MAEPVLGVQPQVEQVENDLFSNLVMEDGLIEAFSDAFLPVPEGVNTKVKLTHYLLPRWYEFERLVGIQDRRLHFLPLNINSQRVTAIRREDGSVPEIKSCGVNIALDIVEQHPEFLIPIQGTPFAICKYPYREYIRTFVDGKRGFQEMGYCYMIIDYSNQTEINEEEVVEQ